MKNDKKWCRQVAFSLCFFVLIAGFCAPTAVLATGETPPIATQSRLFVMDGKLVDESGNRVQLRGISSHGLSWFPQYINADMMRQMAEEWNVTLLRLAMYTEEYNGYCAGDDPNRETLKALIDTAVQDAEALGLYVIIDWHTLSDNNPLKHVDEAIAFFGEMAEKYADKPHVLYEICNEPNGGTTWADVRDYALKVLPVIREHTEAVVLIGTPTWAQDIHKAAEDPIYEYDNIMYTLHFYAATHTEDLRNRFLRVVESGLPVFVSEFGICDASGNGAIDETEADQWLDAMNATGTSFALWNLSNKDESSAMIKSTCTKTSGLTSEDLSPSGRWFVDRLAGGQEINALSSDTVQEQEQPSPEDIVKQNSIYMAGDATLQVKLANNWESGGDYFYLYVAEIENRSGGAYSTWHIELSFSEQFELQGNWNGEYSTQLHTLLIDPANYNQRIESGASLADIGFILKSSAHLSIGETTIAVALE